MAAGSKGPQATAVTSPKAEKSGAAPLVPVSVSFQEGSRRIEICVCCFSHGGSRCGDANAASRPMTAFADISGGLVRAISVREESPREGGPRGL